MRKTQVHRYFAGSIMNEKFLSDIVSNVSIPFALITKYSNLLMALPNREQLIFNSAVALINERQRGDELLYNDALKCKHIYFMTRGHPKHGQGFRILSKKEILESMFDAFSGRVGAVMIKWSLVKLIHPEFACKLADDSIDAQMLLDLVQIAVNGKIDIWQIIGVLSYVNFSGARVIMFLYDDVTVLNAISTTTHKHKKWQGINIMLAAARDIELDILDTFIPDRIVHVYSREDPELLPDVQKFMKQCVTLKCGRKFDPTHLSNPMIHISHLPGGELCKKKSTTFGGYLKIPIEQWDWEYYTSCKEYITQQRYAKNALHLFAKSSVPLASVAAAAAPMSPTVLPSAPSRPLVLAAPLLPAAAPAAPPSVPVASMVVAAPTVPMVLSAAPLALAAPLMISAPSAPSMSAAVPPCASTMPASHSRSSPLLQPPSLASMVPSLSVSTPSILCSMLKARPKIMWPMSLKSLEVSQSTSAFTVPPAPPSSPVSSCPSPPLEQIVVKRAVTLPKAPISTLQSSAAYTGTLSKIYTPNVSIEHGGLFSFGENSQVDCTQKKVQESSETNIGRSMQADASFSV